MLLTARTAAAEDNDQPSQTTNKEKEKQPSTTTTTTTAGEWFEARLAQVQEVQEAGHWHQAILRHDHATFPASERASGCQRLEG